MYFQGFSWLASIHDFWFLRFQPELLTSNILMLIIRVGIEETKSQQDDSSVRLLGGSGGMLPQEILNLDHLRLLLMQSGTRLLFNSCDKTLITILNFKISKGEGIVAGGEIVAGGRGGGESHPPLYETLLSTLDLLLHIFFFLAGKG